MAYCSATAFGIATTDLYIFNRGQRHGIFLFASFHVAIDFIITVLICVRVHIAHDQKDIFIDQDPGKFCSRDKIFFV